MPDFEVFVSWSRPGSHQAAQAFSEWLPDVLPGTKPWVSSEDITKGTPWFASISAQLGRSGACLICVTPENVLSPWLFYEAGAIAHAMQGALICPYLIGVKPGDLAGNPLGQYQLTVFDKEDTWRLIRDINGRLNPPHHEKVLRGNFDANWPTLQRKLAKVGAAATTPKPPDKPDEPDLSAEARHVLLETSQDTNGRVQMTKTMHGFSLTSHNMQLCDGNSARTEAAYREAVNDLVSRKLLESRGQKGEVFSLTKRGWELADELRKQQPPPATAPEPAVTDDADAACLLQSWFGSRTEEQNHQAVAFEDVDRQLKLVLGTAARLLEAAAQRYSYVVEQKGPKFITFRKVLSVAETPYFSNPRRPDF